MLIVPRQCFWWKETLTQTTTLSDEVCYHLDIQHPIFLLSIFLCASPESGLKRPLAERTRKVMMSRELEAARAHSYIVQLHVARVVDGLRITRLKCELCFLTYSWSSSFAISSTVSVLTHLVFIVLKLSKLNLNLSFPIFLCPQISNLMFFLHDTSTSDVWSDKQGDESSGTLFFRSVLDLELGSSGNVSASGVLVVSVGFNLGVVTISFYIVQFLEHKT